MSFSNQVRATIADVADGADGIFQRRAYPDYSASGSAFTTEGNVDAERPKEALRPTQVAGEGAGILGPAGAVLRNTLTAAFKANPQKIGGAPRPRAALAHEFPHARSNRVRVDDAVDRGLAIGCVGASEGAGGPEAGAGSARCSAPCAGCSCGRATCRFGATSSRRMTTSPMLIVPFELPAWLACGLGSVELSWRLSWPDSRLRAFSWLSPR
jgi:hypothetical protein